MQARTNGASDNLSSPVRDQTRDSRPDRPTNLLYSSWSLFYRRGVRVAEGARLESVFARKCDVGSNPTLSAMSFFD